jgi:hypothetical protein
VIVELDDYAVSTAHRRIPNSPQIRKATLSTPRVGSLQDLSQVIAIA